MPATSPETISPTAPGTGELGLPDVLVQFAHLIDNLFADASRANGLTPQQAQLLCALIRGPVGMTELTRQLHLERSSLTGLVDRVQRRGLVTRTPDPNDRRALQISLTGQGAQLATASYTDVIARVAAIMSHVPAADTERLTEIVSGVLTDHGLPPTTPAEVLRANPG
jgi:DNA-binding MarR family transcriptional regulator